jgi:hypothetical protein
MSKKTMDWYNKLTNVNNLKYELNNNKKATESEKKFAAIRKEAERREKNTKSHHINSSTKKYNVPKNFKENEIDYDELEKTFSKRGGKTKKKKYKKRKTKRIYKK